MQQGYQKPQVFFTFSGVETEIELILARSGILVNDLLHRSSLGIGWRRASRLCSVPQDVSGHKKESKEAPAAEGELLCRTQYKFLNLRKTSYPSDQVSDYNESWSSKNWRPSSLFSLYVRINIRIASHFTQGSWRESQTSYPNFKPLHCRVKQSPSLTGNLFSCLFRIFANIFTSENTGVHSTFSSLSKLIQNQWWAPVKTY